MVNIIGVTFKTKYFKLRKSIQFFLIKVLFYLTAALAVKYTHIVVVCKLFCTPPVIFTNIFLQFKHIYKHTFFIWIHPGGGAASPLTLSELLDGGNTLQLRAVCGREGGREREKRTMFTVLCLYLGCCLGLSFSTYLFSFFTPCYQPNLNDLNSIWAQKHLSLPYLWIMERFSGIQNL